MMKKYSILFVISLVVLGVVSLYIYYNYDKNNDAEKNIKNIEDNRKTESILKSEDNTDEEIKETEKQITIDEVPNNTKTKITNNDTKKGNTNNSNNNVSKESTNKTNNIKVDEISTANTSKEKNNIQNNNQNNKKEETKEEVQNSSAETKEDTTKKEDTEKSVTIEYEVPSKISIEDDAEYKAIMKEIYATQNECDKRGDAILDTDYVNISSYKCETQSYKGAIIGYRLKVRYADGTWKEFKKNS